MRAYARPAYGGQPLAAITACRPGARQRGWPPPPTAPALGCVGWGWADCGWRRAVRLLADGSALGTGSPPSNPHRGCSQQQHARYSGQCSSVAGMAARYVASRSGHGCSVRCIRCIPWLLSTLPSHGARHSWSVLCAGRAGAEWSDRLNGGHIPRVRLEAGRSSILPATSPHPAHRAWGRLLQLIRVISHTAQMWWRTLSTVAGICASTELPLPVRLALFNFWAEHFEVPANCNSGRLLTIRWQQRDLRTLTAVHCQFPTTRQTWRRRQSHWRASKHSTRCAASLWSSCRACGINDWPMFAMRAQRSRGPLTATGYRPDTTAYSCWSVQLQFFYRKLKPNARPIDTTTEGLVSPVDGKLMCSGTVPADGLIEQVKQVRPKASKPPMHKHLHPTASARHACSVPAGIAASGTARHCRPVGVSLIPLAVSALWAASQLYSHRHHLTAPTNPAGSLPAG